MENSGLVGWGPLPLLSLFVSEVIWNVRVSGLQLLSNGSF